MPQGVIGWDKVEPFIKDLGFSCDDEHTPVSNRHYRKVVDGLTVVLEPCFVDKRGRLRFESLGGSVYRADDYLFGFWWPPGKTLSQAMDEALQRDIGKARERAHAALQRLDEIGSIHSLYVQSLAGWGEGLTYG